eukprot:331392-Chlamydomonas_euryale.AAC.13
MPHTISVINMGTCLQPPSFHTSLAVAKYQPACRQQHAAHVEDSLMHRVHASMARIQVHSTSWPGARYLPPCLLPLPARNTDPVAYRPQPYASWLLAWALPDLRTGALLVLLHGHLALTHQCDYQDLNADSPLGHNVGPRRVLLKQTPSLPGMFDLRVKKVCVYVALEML